MKSVAYSAPCFADVYNFLQRMQTYAVDGIVSGTGEMISDLDGSVGSRYFLNVANERTCFALYACACVFKVSG